MPKFEENSSNASNASDKILEINETKPGGKGNIIRITSDYYECVPEHWLRRGDKVRKYRCTNVDGDQSCKVCDLIAETGYTDGKGDGGRTLRARKEAERRQA